MGGRDTERDLCDRRRTRRQARLDVLAEGMQASILQLLERVGSRPAGGAVSTLAVAVVTLTLELAGFAGPSGLAVGVDFDSDVLALAEEDAARLVSLMFSSAAAMHWGSLRPSATSTSTWCTAGSCGATFVSPARWCGRWPTSCAPAGLSWLKTSTIAERCASRRAKRSSGMPSSTGLSFDSGAPTPKIGPRLPALLDGAGLVDVDVASVQLVGRDPQSSSNGSTC